MEKRPKLQTTDSVLARKSQTWQECFYVFNGPVKSEVNYCCPTHQSFKRPLLKPPRRPRTELRSSLFIIIIFVGRFFFHVLFASLTIRSCFTVNSSPVKRPIVGLRPPRSNNGSHLGVARVFYWPRLLCEILTAISLLAKSDEATRRRRTCCFKQPCGLPTTPTHFIPASAF